MRSEELFLQSIEKLKELFEQKLNKQAKVYLFGSSVRDDYKRHSDIDIGIEDAESEAITLLRDAIDDLNIPYKVEIVDMNNVSSAMKKAIREEGIAIWDGSQTK